MQKEPSHTVPSALVASRSRLNSRKNMQTRRPFTMDIRSAPCPWPCSPHSVVYDPEQGKLLHALLCSSAVSARCPFARDPELTYDFEVDSEDEWEDEAEGENLSVRRRP